MAIPSLNGLIWRSKWNAPGEGPYSIVAKLLHANSLPPRYLRDVIRWRHPEGHSLLFPTPLQSSNERIASLGRLLQESSISTFARYMHGELAGDEALRYCRTCIGTGFQAAIAQIDGLDDCPIHKEPHLSRCIRCGAKTPPYYLGDGDRFPRFYCGKCGAPFGDDALIERRLDAWRPPEQLDRLDLIHQWLRKIDDYWCFSWPSVSKWDTTRFLEEGEEEHRRRAVFAVLGTLAPDPNLPSPKLGPNVEIFGPYPLTNNQASEHFMPLSSQAFRQLLSETKLDQYRRNLRTPSFGIAVPDDPIVPPSIHAALIWRAQFKRNAEVLDWNTFSMKSIADVVPDLMDPRQTITSRTLFSERIKQGVLAATWCAANRIATEWHHLLINLRDICTIPFDEGWLTACTRWNGRLGCWRDYGYFPVGKIITRDPTSGNANLYLVVA